MDTTTSKDRILSRLERAEFVGREAEMERLLDHARGGSGSNGLAILAPPSSGSSEMLRQAYDRLFNELGPVIPFYFQVKRVDLTAAAAARRFVYEFLAQTIARRANVPVIANASPGLMELAGLAGEKDADWVNAVVRGCQSEFEIDEQSFIRVCLSAPLRAEMDGFHVAVMIDDIENILSLDKGTLFFDDLGASFEHSSIPVVFCGQRRFLYGRTSFDQMALGQLSFTEAGQLVQDLSSRMGVAINDQTRDLIAVQLGCRPAQISGFISSASEAGAQLSSFSLVEQFYTDELCGGRLSRQFDEIFDRIVPKGELQNDVLKLLEATYGAERHRLPIERWQEILGVDDAAFSSLMESLHFSEMINSDGAHVAVDLNNVLLKDYVHSRIELESNERSRAAVIGESMARNIERAPKLMAAFYRRNASVGLLDIMRSFDGQQISNALLDYTVFKNAVKGLSREEARVAVKADIPQVRLPKCVFAAQTSAYYPQLDEICDPERSATAICLDNGNEIAWIAAEIGSKLEAGREIAEFWCDRLEMVAVNGSFENYRIWLVATEGFDQDAMASLNERGAIGTSRLQAEMLRNALANVERPNVSPTSDVYEFIVPMGHDTEMIAAHTIEDIARRHNYPLKAINQIKTALVEACINASEHSLSPDRRIHQRFTINDRKIEITVANRGIRLTESSASVSDNTGRRGWGLKLIRSLMDEVDFEATDDGTVIRMAKYLRESEAEAVGA